MTNTRSSVACRLFLFLLAGVLCWSWTAGTASAQKMLSGSAWRSVTMDTNFPRGTKIRVRMDCPVQVSGCESQTFHGVVAKDVIGGNGNVLVSKGSDVELTTQRSSNNQFQIDLSSISTNGEHFVAEGPRTEREETPAGARVLYSTVAQCSMSDSEIDIPAGTQITFRLNEPYVVEQGDECRG